MQRGTAGFCRVRMNARGSEGAEIATGGDEQGMEGKRSWPGSRGS